MTTRRRIMAAALVAGCGVARAHASIADAVERAASLTPQASRSVLLAAAQAGSALVAVGERGIVLRSTDDGRSWQQMPTPVSVTLTAVRFADADTGYAAGHGGVVLATRDGGRSWTRVLDGAALAQTVLKAAIAANDAVLTKDARRLVAEGADKPLLDLVVLDARHLIVVGAYGIALRSRDGGAGWQSLMGRLDNPDGLHLYAVRHRAPELLVAGEQGLALLSGDGGESFRRLEPPNKGSHFAAELGSAGRVWLAGLQGHVLYSADHGRSWEALPNRSRASVTASALTPDGELITVDQAGLVQRWERGTAVALNAQPLPPINGVLPLPAGGLVLLTNRGALDLKPASGGAR
ncbi:WD40/YVTN/BNR-like repeat-containing protein [Piscinibacter sp.]|uniref:WD40/YVTN/BNR-like repeat-containing protein n=1 Tax=Piscinibacter sp. TaxID=1903157 RepID=UPI0039E5880C